MGIHQLFLSRLTGFADPRLKENTNTLRRKFTPCMFCVLFPDRLIHLVDTLGFKLEVTGDRAILSSASLVLAVRKVDGTNFQTTSVDIVSTDNIQVTQILVQYSSTLLQQIYNLISHFK